MFYNTPFRGLEPKLYSITILRTVLYVEIVWGVDNIKIMPCVEGDRSDCQPEASSIARRRRLRSMVVVEG